MVSYYSLIRFCRKYSFSNQKSYIFQFRMAATSLLFARGYLTFHGSPFSSDCYGRCRTWNFLDRLRLSKVISARIRYYEVKNLNCRKVRQMYHKALRLHRKVLVWDNADFDAILFVKIVFSNF